MWIATRRRLTNEASSATEGGSTRGLQPARSVRLYTGLTPSRLHAPMQLPGMGSGTVNQALGSLGTGR